MKPKPPPFLRNKYLIALVAVGVWLLFFDKNNLLQQYRMHRQLRDLSREMHYYREQILSDSLAIQELMEDPHALERFAREQYLMKKEGEDIFIIGDPRR